MTPITSNSIIYILLANAEMSGLTHNRKGAFSLPDYALDAPSICFGGASQRAARTNRWSNAHLGVPAARNAAGTFELTGAAVWRPVE